MGRKKKSSSAKTSNDRGNTDPSATRSTERETSADLQAIPSTLQPSPDDFPVYNKLDQSVRVIRLLRVHQDQDDSTQTSFSLEEHSLDKVPEYTAISYMWGPEKDGGTIRIDGRVIPLRQNLFKLLNTVIIKRDSKSLTRSPYDVRQVGDNQEVQVANPNPFASGIQRYWIDNLCINQNDMEERSQQVSMMGKIYSSSTALFVWLGPASDNSHHVFDALNAEDVRFSEVGRKTFVKDLTALFQRDYWYRGWIRQEILKAQKGSTYFFCGDRWATITALGKGSPFFNARNARLLGIKPVFELLQVDPPEAAQPLHKLLIAYGEAKCTDIRDRVYSLTSLAADHELLSTMLRIDYAQPMEFLFLQLISYSMKSYDHGFEQAVKFSGRILNINDQTDPSVSSWTEIAAYIQPAPCQQFMLEFVDVARAGRSMSAATPAPDEDRRLPTCLPKHALYARRQREYGIYMGLMRPIINPESPSWLRSLLKDLRKDDWYHSLRWFTTMSQKLARNLLPIDVPSRPDAALRWMDAVINTLLMEVERMRNARSLKIEEIE